MHLKKERVIFFLLVFSMALVRAHVCNDVREGSPYYQEGCEPFLVTVPGGAQQNGNQVTLTINVASKPTPYPPATSCINPWSGTLPGVYVVSVTSSPTCSGCFSINNPGTFDIASNTNRNYNVVVTINSGAPKGTYSLTFAVDSTSTWISPRYVRVDGVEVDGGTGCTSDSQCSAPTPYCNTATHVCVACLQASHCNDNNECTTDACSSNVCSHTNVAAGTACTGGNCCSGTCDTTVGNTNFHADCRTGPQCVGTSWQYIAANQGADCGTSGGKCNGGLCEVSGCTSDSQCSAPTPYCNTATGQCAACLQASHCNDNNECTTDSCSSNSCSHTNVAAGTACTGGNCCSGTCDTTVGNTNFHADCRSGPSCVGTSWQYIAANQGGNCGTGGTCNGGLCVTTGCTSDSQCSAPTPYCNTATGQCVECKQASHCNDNNECTTDSCASNSCSHTNVAAGTACTGGNCCSGTCDTTVGNTNFHADCRSGPSCVGTSWQYSAASEGGLCGGFECRECGGGLCNYDDSTRCTQGEICEAGTCVAGEEELHGYLSISTNRTGYLKGEAIGLSKEYIESSSLGFWQNFKNFFKNMLGVSGKAVTTSGYATFADSNKPSLINNTGDTELKGYVYMKIINRVTLSEKDYYNETTLLTINPKGYLALDSLWPEARMQDSGNYSVYAEFRDNEKKVIETEEGFLNDSFNFQVVEAGVSCGDGSCNGGEDCSSCPEDCEECEEECTPIWRCTWSPCKDGIQKEICDDINNCTANRINESVTQACSVEADCEDKDGDGYGVGEDCLGPDLDDNNPDITDSFEEVPGDETPTGDKKISEKLIGYLLWILAIIVILIAILIVFYALRKFRRKAPEPFLEIRESADTEDKNSISQDSY